MTTVRRVSDLGELSPAEAQVLAELDTGEVTCWGWHAVPEPGNEARRVRAGLIRLLLLGDDPDRNTGCTRRGFGSRARGSRTADLEGCRDLRDLALVNCRFDEGARCCGRRVFDTCF